MGITACRSRKAFWVLTAVLAAPWSADAQTPSISTLALGLPISWDECRTRVSRALTAEGYASLNDTGNGWEAWARGGAASVTCITGSSETVVTIVTSGSAAGFEAALERTRLLDRIRNDGAPQPAAPPQPPTARSIGQGWGVDAGSVRGRNRQRFSVSCPPDGSLGPAWGSDLYTDDSSVCTAAVHAGAITVGTGGTVTIEVRPGLDAYRGSNRNGVRSADFGPWEGSFIVIRTPPVSSATGGSGWKRDREPTSRPKRGAPHVLLPAGGPAGGVLGTDTYADESSVCGAAVHAGLISLFGGGTVTIELRPGADAYQGTTRNGLTSEAFGASPGSFVFVR